MRSRKKRIYEQSTNNIPVAPRLGFFRFWSRIISSAIIVSILLFIIVNFYLFASIISLDSFLYIFLIITLLTDGLFLLIHLIRRPLKQQKYSMDPSKLSVVIACYNGAHEVGETIEHLIKKIPAKQIIVVSDASTDNTVKVAKSYGVKVVENKTNMNKAFSVSIGVHHVKTPYVLVLDDDVLIGDAVIPTSLLDEGYSAVAFNVMPVKTDTFVNAIQQFEYRASMYIGKNLRASVSAIGNVSGAIGLFHTSDLKQQAYLHSGQYSGEDEQRTIISQIYSEGKGVTYAEETVYTSVPNTFHSLYRQRAFGWSLSVPELIPLYLYIIISPRYHFLLKSEKAYNTYIYLTDPLRVLFLWTLLLRPKYLLATYAMYLVFNVAMWLKTRRKDQFLVVLTYPFYTLWLSLCRFIGNFYWLKVKAAYFKKRYHKLPRQRFVVAESMIVFFVFALIWTISGYHFTQDLRLFNKIRTSRLEEQAQNFDYDNDQSQKITSPADLNIAFSKQQPSPGTFISVELEKGDTLRAVAHKAVDKSTEGEGGAPIPYEKRTEVDTAVGRALQTQGGYLNIQTSTLLISSAEVQQAITAGLQGGANGT